METALNPRPLLQMFSFLASRKLHKYSMLAMLLGTCLLVSAGCSSSKPKVNPDDKLTRAVLGVLSEYYGDYLQFHKGKPPKTPEDFYKYLDSRAEDLKLFNVEDPAELHNSHRDGQPLVIVCGKKITSPDAPDSPWAAYEQTGVDGKRLAVRVRGGIHKLTADQFEKIFSKE